MRLAYSFQRYSSPEQGDGDSIRRQSDLASAWCKRHSASLDTSACYTDRGTSAFRGKHRKEGAPLRCFLDDVEAGRIPRGSTLLIENMDRLSREKPVVGVNLLTGILIAGIRVVQLAPDELELTEDSDLFSLFRGQMSQSLGHDESKKKSSRLAEVWGAKKADARRDRSVQTTRVPAWLKVVGRRKEGKHAVGGEFQLIPKRVTLVRRMFALALAGWGLSLIVRQMSQEAKGGWGRSGKWSKAYVHKILSGRAVLGEHQPLKDGKPDGAPIAGYYPAVIDEDTWLQAQGALASRKDKQGRIGHKVASLFTGLLWDARTKGKLLIALQTRGPRERRYRVRVLVPAGSMEGNGPATCFNYQVFEDAILSRLRELKPEDVLGEEAAGESATLAAELAATRTRLRTIEAELTGSDKDAGILARAGRALEDKCDDLQRRLAEALQKEANPRAAAWTEAKGLLDVAQDEQGRLRLRTLLRNMVSEVLVLIVPRDTVRLAVVQMHFQGGGRRDYLLLHKAPRLGRPEKRCVASLADVAQLGALDLRKPAHAKALEKELLVYPLEKLMK